MAAEMAARRALGERGRASVEPLRDAGCAETIAGTRSHCERGMHHQNAIDAEIGDRAANAKVIASAYAERGFRVFPANPATKRALVKWKHGATTDADLISAWWDRWPAAMIGLRTAGLLVIDCDTDKETGAPLGEEEAAELGMDLWIGFRVRTPSGGLHVYFADPGQRAKNSAKEIAQHIDTRGTGGYIIAAGSVRADGGAYVAEGPSLLDGAPPHPPVELLRAVLRGTPWGRALIAPPRTATAPGGFGANTSRYGAAALRKAEHRMQSAQPGARNDTISRNAFGLFQLAGGGAISTTEVERLVVRCCEAVGLDARETRGLIRSARKGLERPRHVPVVGHGRRR